MLGRRIQIFTLFIMLMFGTITGCIDTRKDTQETKPVAQKEEVPPVSAADQETFKQKIAKLGIRMYKGAKFVEVRRKAKDSPLLVAVYEVSAQHEKDYDKVKSFYTAGLKKALAPKGWVPQKVAENVTLYRKGFEIFFVEFALAITPPDTKKVMIMMHYGG